MAPRAEKTRRIYRELGLQLRSKTPKRRVKAKLRDDRRPATRLNKTSPALQPRFTFRGNDVAEILERARKEVGFPATIRVDQGQRVCVARP